MITLISQKGIDSFVILSRVLSLSHVLSRFAASVQLALAVWKSETESLVIWQPNYTIWSILYEPIIRKVLINFRNTDTYTCTRHLITFTGTVKQCMIKNAWSFFNTSTLNFNPSKEEKDTLLIFSTIPYFSAGRGWQTRKLQVWNWT